MEKKGFLLWKKIFLILLVAVCVIGVIHVVCDAVALANNTATSFPWWTALYLPGLLYLLTVLLLGAGYLVFRRLSR